MPLTTQSQHAFLVFIIVCGDDVCSTEDGEDCSTCPGDCGKCPISAAGIAGIALTCITVLAFILGGLGVSIIMYTINNIVFFIASHEASLG